MKQNKRKLLIIGIAVCALSILIALFFFWPKNDGKEPFRFASTVAGLNAEFGEPFGIAVKGRDIFVSDGQSGTIFRLADGSAPTAFAQGLDTPSAIAFDKAGNLVVADSGSHSIRSIDPNGVVTNIAGIPGKRGSADGDGTAATFNAPIGIAIAKDGKIFVADTYNDRIRVIENGQVTTLAGGTRGFADGPGLDAKFDTPAGLAMLNDKLLVADMGNRRIRVVEADGRVWTLAGNGEYEGKNGILSASSFVQPSAIAVRPDGTIFVADGNSIRQIGGDIIPLVRTISDKWRGLRDGHSIKARFNRPSGLAFDNGGGLLVADSENRLLRRFTSDRSGHEITSNEVSDLRDKPEEFRLAQPPRWPYDPPDAKHDIAGTLAEIRGEMKPGAEDIHFHNGLDIAGGYGSTAHFVRNEKVLRPIAAENFGTLRELVRMPTLGYIHLRLGRDSSSIPFNDDRFQFERDKGGKIIDVRIPRGSTFKAGEAVGTLNAMNHVHLIAGRSGSEMNALDALILPGLTDSRPPTIENVTLFDEDWKPAEPLAKNSRIMLKGKTRIVVRAYDQSDGNAERRRLGVYKVGYQVFNADGSPLTEPKWTIIFDRIPASPSIALTYANGSRSGATGETIFNYIATNYVDGDESHEDFLDVAKLGPGHYSLRINVGDYFGNISSRDVEIEVIR